MLCETSSLRWLDLASSFLPGAKPEFTEGAEFVPVHSGKAALNHVFSYLRATGVLKNKNSPVLVPPWLGYWVYSAVQPHGFPVLREDDGVKAALVYHQYGFAQRLDEVADHCDRRKIVFIEDCAHALGGTYRGRPLGSFGAAGIFSLSKFYPSYVGGGVTSPDAALRAHVARLEASGSALLGAASFGVKLALEKFPGAGVETSFLRRANEFMYAGYPYARRPAWTLRLCQAQGGAGELEARRRNYGRYRALLSNHDALMELDAEACPYVVPFLHPKRDALERMASGIRALGVETGVYNFDRNRNMFDPRYEPCVWLPVHGGVGDELLNRIVSVVKGEA